MTELKTQPTRESVRSFLNSIDEETQRNDSFEISDMMKDITGAEPRMWGPGIIGFGSYHYKYKSGREADWFLTGFSPRKNNISLYIMNGFGGYDELLSKLGRHKIGKACLYIKKLSDIDKKGLYGMIHQSVQYLIHKHH